MTEPDKTDTPAKTPAPTERWGSLAQLRREMDRLFDDFGSSGWPVPGAMRLMSDMPPVPAMDLVERDDAYEITAELPGIDPKDVELKVSGDMLTLKGEKREEKETEEKDRRVSERRFGSFQRTMRLPPDADTDRIGAATTNGVLKITVPKSAEAKAREKKIEISGG